MKRILLLILTFLCATMFVVGCSGGETKSITLDKTEVQIAQYDEITLVATKTDNIETIEWLSSDQTIATVDNNGKVVGVGIGTAVITAKADGAEATCSVKVGEQMNIASIVLDRTEMQVRVGGSVSANAYIKYKGAQIDGVITWESANQNIAIVDSDGRVTGLTEGQTAITARTTYNGRIIEKSFVVKVVLDLEIGFGSKTSVELKTNGLISPGENTYTLTPYTKFNNQTVNATYVFESENEDVATVNDAGVITATGAGQTNIKMTVKITSDCEIKDREFTELFAVDVSKSETTINSIDGFEVYNNATHGVVDKKYVYELTANTLDIDLSAYNLSAEEGSFARISQGDKKATATVSVEEDSEIIKIDGSGFGSTIYGDDIIIEVETPTIIIKTTVNNVVTKYLRNIKDVENMLFYGNIDLQSEGRNYHGYFVLANDIDFGGRGMDLRREASNVADLATGANTFNGDFGFDGIFDGQNHSIFNVVTQGSGTAGSGLFLNTTRNSVIKNLNYSMSYAYYLTAFDCPTYPLARNLAGTIENCEFDITVLDISTFAKGKDYYSLALNVTYAYFRDVIINFDASNVPAGAEIGALCGYQCYLNEGSNQAMFNNVELNVIIPTDYADHAEEGEYLPTVSTFTAYRGDYEPNTSGLTFNVLSKQFITDTTAYEVYSGVSGTTPTLNVNKLTTAVNVNEQTISRVTVKGVNNASAIEVSSDKYTYVDGTLSIDSSVFGSNVYGDVEIAVSTPNTVMIITKPVMTKYLSSKEDIDNLFIYGGATKHENGQAQVGSTYDGYFVMTQNININGAWLLAYRTENSDNYYTYLKVDNSGETGFKGIFDGKGYTIYNYAGADRVGLFGNVSKNGVVKNVGVKGKLYLKTTSQKETYALGFNFAGTLENSYIEMDVDYNQYMQTASPTAMNISQARFKDVVIKFNATNAPYNTTENRFGWLAAQVGTYGGSSWYNLVSCSNVVAFVQLPSEFDAINGEITPGSWYGSEGTLTGITRYAYDDTTVITMTDSTYWTTTQGAQITWKSLSTIS